MRRATWMVAAAAITMGSIAAEAATVTAESGEVFVNAGTGYAPLAGAVDAKAGTQVLLRKDAVAQIAYGDSCTVKLGSGRVWQVAAKVPCEAGVSFIDLSKPMGVTGGEPEGSLKDTPAPTAGETIPVEGGGGTLAGGGGIAGLGTLGTVAVVGAVVAGGVFAITEATKDDKPPSP